MTAAQAYAEVERLTRRRARNFAYGIMVLPRPKRRAIAAVYAFAREVDDVADGELPATEKRARLEALRDALGRSPNGSATLIALADARARYGIPESALHDLVEGGGRRLRDGLGGRIGRAVWLFARGGLAALDALEAADYDVFTRRPSPSRARLARAAVAALVG